MIHNTQNALGSSGLCKPSSDNEHKSQKLRSFFLLLMLLVQSEYIPDSWSLSVLGDRKVCAYATSEPEEVLYPNWQYYFPGPQMFNKEGIKEEVALMWAAKKRIIWNKTNLVWHSDLNKSHWQRSSMPLFSGKWMAFTSLTVSLGKPGMVSFPPYICLKVFKKPRTLYLFSKWLMCFIILFSFTGGGGRLSESVTPLLSYNPKLSLGIPAFSSVSCPVLSGPVFVGENRGSWRV